MIFSLEEILDIQIYSKRINPLVETHFMALHTAKNRSSEFFEQLKSAGITIARHIPKNYSEESLKVNQILLVLANIKVFDKWFKTPKLSYCANLESDARLFIQKFNEIKNNTKDIMFKENKSIPSNSKTKKLELIKTKNDYIRFLVKNHALRVFVARIIKIESTKKCFTRADIEKEYVATDKKRLDDSVMNKNIKKLMNYSLIEIIPSIDGEVTYKTTDKFNSLQETK